MRLNARSDAIRVRRISHIAIGVFDIERQADFYVRMCGLRAVDRTSQHVYLRAAGSHHHVFELIGGHKGLHHVSFQLEDDEDIGRCANILAKQGVRITLSPVSEVEPGVGKLLRFLDPEGNPIELVSGVEDIRDSYETGAVKPLRLNHAVLYAGDLTKQQSFYESVLGMRETDNVPHLMTFLRCNPNHHDFGFIALPRRGLQHAAFDLPGRSELSELLIHMGDGGVKRVDGPGRHGPGNMLFTYFEDADRNLLEWVTEVQQIDEATHQPRAWDPAPALNLWRSPQHVGPPRGFRWLLNLLPVISKLSRFRPRTPSQQVQCK
jgi:catechol 2,3-dioxygenase-like lactoylglutathione lyase family enzyme